MTEVPRWLVEAAAADDLVRVQNTLHALRLDRDTFERIRDMAPPLRVVLDQGAEFVRGSTFLERCQLCRIVGRLAAKPERVRRHFDEPLPVSERFELCEQLWRDGGEVCVADLEAAGILGASGIAALTQSTPSLPLERDEAGALWCDGRLVLERVFRLAASLEAPNDIASVGAVH